MHPHPVRPRSRRGRDHRSAARPGPEALARNRARNHHRLAADPVPRRVPQTDHHLDQVRRVRAVNLTRQTSQRHRLIRIRCRVAHRTRCDPQTVSPPCHRDSDVVEGSSVERAGVVVVLLEPDPDVTGISRRATGNRLGNDRIQRKRAVREVPRQLGHPVPALTIRADRHPVRVTVARERRRHRVHFVTRVTVVERQLHTVLPRQVQMQRPLVQRERPAIL